MHNNYNDHVYHERFAIGQKQLSRTRVFFLGQHNWHERCHNVYTSVRLLPSGTRQCPLATCINQLWSWNLGYSRDEKYLSRWSVLFDAGISAEKHLPYTYSNASPKARRRRTRLIAPLIASSPWLDSRVSWLSRRRGCRAVVVESWLWSRRGPCRRQTTNKDLSISFHCITGVISLVSCKWNSVTYAWNNNGQRSGVVCHRCLVTSSNKENGTMKKTQWC